MSGADTRPKINCPLAFDERDTQTIAVGPDKAIISLDAVRKQFRNLSWRKPDWNNSTFQSTIKKSSLIYFSFPNFFFLLLPLVCASARVLQRFINCCYSFWGNGKSTQKSFLAQPYTHTIFVELLKNSEKILAFFVLPCATLERRIKDILKIFKRF